MFFCSVFFTGVVLSFVGAGKNQKCKKSRLWLGRDEFSTASTFPIYFWILGLKCRHNLLKNECYYIHKCMSNERIERSTFFWNEMKGNNLFSNQKVYIRKSVNLLQLLQIIVNAK